MMETRRTSEHVVQQAIDNHRGLFPTVHRRRLHAFADGLVDFIVHDGRFRVAFDAFLPGVLEDLLLELDARIMRTLVHEFHQWRAAVGLPVDARVDEAFRQFEMITRTEEFQVRLVNDYPVLDGLLEQACTDRTTLVRHILRALIEDRSDLRAEGLVHGTEIRSIRISSGDAHHGGQKVAIVSTEAEKVVFKPRSLQIEDLASAAFKLINPWLEPGCELSLPRHLDRTTYGWQEFVARSDLKDTSALRRFRYRMGAYLAVFTALGSTDLHFENVVAAGANPTFIDLETLFQHGPAGGAGSREGVAQLDAPILQTMLLPVRTPHAWDVDISGMGNDQPQTSNMLSYSVVDARTDATRIERAAFQVVHDDNLPRLRGHPVPPELFMEDLVEGLRSGLRAVRIERERLLDTVADYDAPVRQVIRPTNVYTKFLAASLHPKYLRSWEARRALFSKLPSPRGLVGQTADAARDLELVAMDRHDVPYFVAKMGDGSLTTEHGRVDEVYDSSLTERTSEVLRRVLAAPFVQHEHAVRMCFITSRPARPLSGLDSRPGKGFLDEVFEGSTSLASTITEVLRDTAFEIGERLTWLVPVHAASEERLLLMPHLPVLYESGGITVALAAHAAANGGIEERDTALRSMPPEGDADHAGPTSLSLMSGVPSEAYIAHEVGTLLSAPGMLQRRDELWSRILKTVPTPEHEVDVVGGHSATAAYLVDLYGTRLPRDAERFVMHSAHVMAARLRDRVLDDSGVGHGALGVAWCLARVGRFLDDARLLAAAEPTLVREAAAATHRSALHPRVGHAAWCRGTGGALLALAEGLTALGWDFERVQSAVDPLVERGAHEVMGEGRDVTLCHGSSGYALSLARVGTLLDRPELLSMARTIFDRRRRRAAKDGASGGLADTTGQLTYLLGLSGVAHADLILDRPAWGNPLALTATRGN